MPLEQKRAWIMATVTVVTYAIYLAVILGTSAGVPLAEVPYVAPLLWTVGAAIVATIVLNIAAGIATPKEDAKKDVRDREINRFGEHVGQSFVVIGAVAAILMAMAETPYFWIANAIYLCFVLSSLLGSIARIAVYRWGFHPW